MTLSTRDRSLLGGVVVIALFAVFYLLVLTPQRHEADHLQNSIAAAQKKLSAAQSEYATGRTAEQRLAATTTQYAAARNAVPQQSDIPALLRLLQRTAGQAHVSIDSINLSGSASSASSATTTTAASPTTATTGSTGSAQTVPVSLTFGGGYQALNRMVRRLDTLVSVSGGRLHSVGPLVGISSVQLTPGGAAASNTSTLTVSLSATIYQHAAASTVTGATPEGSS